MAPKRKSPATAGTETNGHYKRRAISDEHAKSSFRKGLFGEQQQTTYTEDYKTSKPYKHGVIHNLLDPALLRDVRDEIQANISFTPKETDIYKIYQSGDLANLDGLDDSALRLLPSLVKLREALYSSSFREYLSHVTGTGALSGSKTDMAVNIYTPSCHLLCHDDVIGSRRVSYILYLTSPDIPWKAEWGGALRLYPTEQMQEKDGSEMRVPSAEFSTVIPPAFNQLSFFAVQPGESFHDVEEVYARSKPDGSDEDGGRVRMAISGWYHIPQPGEEGFEEGALEKQVTRSSLAQLQGKADKYDLPQPRWIDHSDDIPGARGDGEDDVEMSEEDLSFLIPFMNPRYLTPETVEDLAETFSEESSLQLGLFLSEKFASALRPILEEQDMESSHSNFWKTARPPHKHRFLYHQAGEKNRSNEAVAMLQSLVDELFPSTAFQKWLSLATGLELGDCNVLARRFRRGLDYTLATEYEDEKPQLEVCLGVTPAQGWGEQEIEVQDDGSTSPDQVDGQSKTNGATDSEGDPTTDEQVRSEGGVGGYEVYMAGDDDEADGAGSDHGVNVPSSHTGAGKRREKADPAIYKSGGDDGDDGILFTMPASWNMLSVVLRDRGTLKFVKYISKSAPGDRWDIIGEFAVEDQEDEEDIPGS